MKKSLFYIAAMALAVSCSNEMVDEIDIANDGAAETTFVNLNLNFEESIDNTRILVDTDETETGTWKTAWEYGDEITVYSIASGEYKTLSFDGTSFSGDVYTGDNRIYHKYDSWSLDLMQDGNNKYVGLYTSSSLFSNGGSPTVVSKDVVTFEADSTADLDVEMQQVGAAIDLKLQFENLPFGLDLSYVTIGGVPDGGTESDYTSFPTYIWTDPTADIDGTFAKYTDTGTSNYYCYTDIEEDETYSFQFGVLPFTIEAGKKLNVTLNFNYGALKYSFDVESTEEFEFARATHNEIDYLIDLDNLLGDTWLAEAEPFSDTSAGTETDPIEIKTAEELAYLSLITLGVIAGVDTDGVYYELINDLDLDGNEWSPIGSSSNPFQGHFDGGGKTISYLTTASDGKYQGLFGYINNASISDITITNPSVVGLYYVGAICGYCEYSEISKCAVTDGYITGISRVGGIVGSSYESTIKACYNIGNVSSVYNWGIGGIVGFSHYSSVIACYNMGVISGNWGIGGIVGCNANSTVITACYNTGNVICNNDDSGGYIFGYEYGASELVTVTECYYLPASSTVWNEHGTLLSSVAELNGKVGVMNAAAGDTYFTEGIDGTHVPSLLGESIEYIEPVDLVDDFTSNGGITGDGYHSNDTIE